MTHAAARHRDVDRRFDASLGGPATTMRCCRYASASRTSSRRRAPKRLLSTAPARGRARTAQTHRLAGEGRSNT